MVRENHPQDSFHLWHQLQVWGIPKTNLSSMASPDPKTIGMAGLTLRPSVASLHLNKDTPIIYDEDYLPEAEGKAQHLFGHGHILYYRVQTYKWWFLIQTLWSPTYRPLTYGQEPVLIKGPVLIKVLFKKKKKNRVTKMQSTIILLYSFHSRYCFMILNTISLSNSLEIPAGFLRQFQQNKKVKTHWELTLPLPIRYSFIISFLPLQSMWKTKEIFTPE